MCWYIINMGTGIGGMCGLWVTGSMLKGRLACILIERSRKSSLQHNWGNCLQWRGRFSILSGCIRCRWGLGWSNRGSSLKDSLIGSLCQADSMKWCMLDTMSIRCMFNTETSTVSTLALVNQHNISPDIYSHKYYQPDSDSTHWHK